MHGLSPQSPSLVNAEVDSMGGVIDGGARLDIKSSPRRAAIEKAQVELRLEFDVREERRRELEFLEKGGNPLDFKPGPATSISIQSTSVTDQHTDHEAKGSFALAASPHGDSVDSSARPLGRESTTADNLLLFDGEKDALLGDRNVVYPCGKGDIVPQEQPPQLRGRNAKESDGPQVFLFGVRSRAYARRNRARSSHDNAHAGHSNRSSMIPSSRHNSRDAKGSIRETHLVEDHFVSSICNSKTTSPNTNLVSKSMLSDNPMDIELVPEQGYEATFDATKVGELECKEVDGRLSQVALEQCPDLRSFTPSDLEGGDHAFAGLHSAPSVAKERKENSNAVAEVNGSTSNMNENVLMNENQINGNSSSGNAASGSTKCLVSEFHCSQVNGGLDKNLVSSVNSNSRKVNGSLNGSVKEQTSLLEMRIPTPDADVEEKNDSRSVDVQVSDNHALSSVPSSISNADVQVKVEEEIGNSSSDLQSEMGPVTNIEGNNLVPLVDNSDSRNASHCVGLPSSVVPINCKTVDANHSTPGFAGSTQLQMEMDCHSQLANKKHEDAILEEARAIEARRRRIRELCSRNAPSENRRKSHWDFVLEEMAWLANDFMQERVWKTAAAAQISHWAAFGGRAKFIDENVRRKQRKVAHTLAKAVLHFWQSIEMLHGREDQKTEMRGCNSASFVYQKENSIEPIKDKTDAHTVSQGISKSKDSNEDNEGLQFPIHRFVLRFLKYSKSLDYPVQAEAPMTPDQISDTRILQLSWEDQNSEESLFTTVPPGAMEYYRKSIESHWAQDERVASAARQEEFETSGFDFMAEFKARETVDGDDDGEIGIYLPTVGFESCKSSKSAQRTKKTLQKYVGPDLPYEQGPESKRGNQPSSSVGKRPSSSLNNVCSIPTKRMRTAARQRVVSPFGAGVAGSGQLASKTDASSGDTSSFHDDQTSVHVGSHRKKILEVESTGDFVKQLPFDATDSSAKPKKKKAKYMGFRNTMGSVDSLGLPSSVKGSSTFEQRWQFNSMTQCEQRDHLKKRLDGHQLDLNGSIGMYGQHAAKKPKILKQPSDASLETTNPVSCSIPSPVASQMSNMSNPNKFIKMIASRDRGRKTKALKISAGQTGSGCPWSVYEDQALVVLVHDMGPNWELVSDAINSCLQFKCIFRKPKECKERHKELMDRNSGDGADSAEDSGSSQPYPSTLPGIPKGSARQLFQRLQGPMEEETLKAHFEKIILIGQQLHSRRNQHTNPEGKLISTTVHSSHILALSQAYPNNLNGALLTPLDLCDATMSSPDVLSPGYQGSLNGGLAVTNHQGSLGPVLPASVSNPILQGSSGMVLGNSLSSPSATVNAAARDVQRYGVQRPSSLPIDEQQRMQHYSQLLSNRNIQHSSAAVSGAMSAGIDRGVRMPPGASGMGMMCGINRGMTIPRPAFQGIGSPSMINMGASGNVLSPNGVGMPSSANIHSGAVSGQVNPMMRPREALQMLRPGQNPDEQRQMMIHELQMQVSQGGGPGVIPYSGLNTTFSNQTVHPPVQTFPVQHQQQQMPQQSHVLSNTHHPHLQGSNHNPHQQPYVIRLTKENHQLQQRLLHQQQQQQFASPNSSIPHSQPQLQHAMSPLPNNSQIQQQSSAQSASLPPPNSQHPITATMNSTPLQAQQQQHHGPQGLGRTPQSGGALTNQMLKQRQRQQLQQQPRQHPQQRHRSQPQAKLMKGIGRGSMLMHQNLPADASHVNGMSPVAGIQIPDKGEQSVMHLIQGNQGLYPGSSRTPVPLGKQLGPQPSNQVQQQKMFSRPLQSSSNQQLQTPHLDKNQGQVQVPSNLELSGSHQPCVSSPLVMTSQQQQELHRQTSQTQQAVQRVLQNQKNRQTSSDASVPSQGDAEGNSQLMNSTFQMGTGTVSQCAVPSNVPGLSATSPSQWKEPAFDANTVSSTSNLPSTGNSLQSNASGSEPMPSSGQRLVSQGHYSGNVSVHGHNVCIRQQQPQQQLHQQQQQGQGPGGGSHVQPSVSGPG